MNSQLSPWQVLSAALVWLSYNIPKGPGFASHGASLELNACSWQGTVVHRKMLKE